MYIIDGCNVTSEPSPSSGCVALYFFMYVIYIYIYIFFFSAFTTSRLLAIRSTSIL